MLPGGSKFKLNIEKAITRCPLLKKIAPDTLWKNRKTITMINSTRTAKKLLSVMCVSDIHKILYSKFFEEGKAEKQLAKLHMQMAHPPMERFVN